MKLHEWGIHPLHELTQFIHCPWFERTLLLFCICGMVQYAATKGTGGRSGGATEREDSPDASRCEIIRGTNDDGVAVTNLCFTGISISTNGISLSVAWPTNFFPNGTTLDFFAKRPSLTNAWQWFAYCQTLPAETNLYVIVDCNNDLNCPTNPRAMFFKVQDRATCAETMADSDGDGLTDAEEIEAGTNPRDMYSFYRHVTVITTTSDDLTDTTNYVAWGTSALGWEANDITSCWTLPTTNTFTVMSTNGPMYVKSYRDLNRNGQYDSETDIIQIQQVPPLTAISSFTFHFGDVDGDGISDATERLHGTDPYDKFSRCFNMSLTIEEVPHATNALTAKVAFEDAGMWGPNVVTGTALSIDLGHLMSTNADSVVLTFWDDINGNSIIDTNEWSTTMTFSPSGHENNIKWSAKSAFDRDNDGMPDYWELRHADAGLSPANAADALQDSDDDGLINYHEYWANCDPGVPDGSNTLLSVCSRSVDDRIHNIVPSNAVDRFVNFFENGSNGVFVANTNFWLRDVDVSCVSVWNDGVEQGSMTATAITYRHVIMAAHWCANRYCFCTTNGQIITRRIERTYHIPDSDILLGRLDADLPESVQLPSVLSSNLVNSISQCKYLPGVCMNNKKAATILELDSLNCNVKEQNGPMRYHMGKTSAINVVSPERIAVWSATDVGNSSSPVFLLAGNELIFLFSKHLGYREADAPRTTWGPVISYRLTEIQNRINQWEGTNAANYQISIIQNFDLDF